MKRVGPAVGGDFPRARHAGRGLTRARVFAPGGGFVFNTVHTILPDVPPQNIVAMFEAVAEFG
jgi:uroporphyrinogen-III decarboxylase